MCVMAIMTMANGCSQGCMRLAMVSVSIFFLFSFLTFLSLRSVIFFSMFLPLFPGLSSCSRPIANIIWVPCLLFPSIFWASAFFVCVTPASIRSSILISTVITASSLRSRDSFSTFPLCVYLPARLRLSSKAMYLVDFALGNYNFLSSTYQF